MMFMTNRDLSKSRSGYCDPAVAYGSLPRATCAAVVVLSSLVILTACTTGRQVAQAPVQGMASERLYGLIEDFGRVVPFAVVIDQAPGAPPAGHIRCPSWGT